MYEIVINFLKNIDASKVWDYIRQLNPFAENSEPELCPHFEMIDAYAPTSDGGPPPLRSILVRRNGRNTSSGKRVTFSASLVRGRLIPSWRLESVFDGREEEMLFFEHSLLELDENEVPVMSQELHEDIITDMIDALFGNGNINYSSGTDGEDSASDEQPFCIKSVNFTLIDVSFYSNVPCKRRALEAPNPDICIIEEIDLAEEEDDDVFEDAEEIHDEDEGKETLEEDKVTLEESKETLKEEKETLEEAN